MRRFFLPARDSCGRSVKPLPYRGFHRLTAQPHHKHNLFDRLAFIYQVMELFDDVIG
jgi:hypothetical protein